MEVLKNLLLIGLLLVFEGASSQEQPPFLLTDIGKSGCSVYFPGMIPELVLSYAEDSSKVYVMELHTDFWGPYSFGLILVDIASGDLNGEELPALQGYLSFMRQSYGIVDQQGEVVQDNPDMADIQDFWFDSNNNYWSIRAFAKKDKVAVLFIIGPEVFPYDGVEKVFFDNFRFPE
jgi:hypothetical protein